MNKKRRIPNSVCETLERRQLLTAATISFAPHVDFVAGTDNVALVAADFNGDGNEDLAVADHATDRVSIFFGNGGGGFSAGPILALSAPPVSMIAGDLNGDGKPDLIVGCTATANQSTTTVTTFLNTGAGTFGLGQITSVESNAVFGEPVGLAAGDFNGNGQLDLAVTDYSSEQISILLGNGTGTFAAPDNYQADAHPTAIAEADFNDDSYPDLAVTSTLSDLSSGTISNQVSLLLGSSTGTFTTGANVVTSTAGVSDSVEPANLTTAATPGLVVGNSNGSATLVTNTAGTIAESATASLAGGATAVASGDFNLDGNTDIVASDGNTSSASTANAVTIAPGAGSGTISSPLDFATGTEPADVVVADFNNDGKPDIATANEGGGTVSVLINNTDIALVTTKTTLVADNTSAPAGSAVTLTATVAGSSTSPLTGESLPTGTVNFYDGSTLLGSSAIVATTNQAVFSTTGLTIGSHKLKAIYEADTAYATSTSAAVVETVTPTATQGPDLVGTFISSTLPAVVAPGETGTITVKVTNQGNTIATGSIVNAVYLSLDNLLDSDDQQLVTRGTLAKEKVNLKPGASATVTGTVTIPLNTPVASYLFAVQLNATSSLAESISTNDLVVSPTTYQVADVFGTVSGRKGVTLQLADDDGTPGTFKLTGPGSATVNVGDAGVDLVLDGTTAASVLTLTSKGGDFDLHDITADSAIGTIRAATSSVSDAITLPGGASSITFDTVGNATLTSSGGIKALTVTSWAGGSITANWIGTLRSKQNFGPTLLLNGDDAPGVTLNTATIGGAIGNSPNSWTVTGNINKIAAASYASAWQLNTGDIKSFASTGGFSGVIDASNIAAITIRGDLTNGRISATQLIGTLRVTGQATNAFVSGGGSIHSIIITQTADAASRFLATSLPKRALIDGVSVNPLNDPRFTG